MTIERDSYPARCLIILLGAVVKIRVWHVNCNSASMTIRGRSRAATRWIFIIASQLAPLLLLESCKNDRAASAETESQELAQKRAVFGSASERDTSRTNGYSTINPPKLDADKPTQRATGVQAHRRAITPTSRSEPAASQRSRMQDPGRSHAPDPNVSAAANHGAMESTGERYLHYEPPGSLVGDPGELPSKPQMPRSNSIESLVYRWADTLLTGNLGAHLSLFSPKLDHFNGAASVSQEVVRTFKSTMLADLAGVRHFEIDDLRLRPSDAGLAYAEFRIESDAVNSKINGSYRLELREVDGQWKIYGEEKLQPISRRSSQ